MRSLENANKKMPLLHSKLRAQDVIFNLVISEQYLETDSLAIGHLPLIA